VTRFNQKFNDSIEGREVSKRISESLVGAVLPLSVLGSNDNVRSPALSAPPVVEISPVIQHEL
jgi:hypothetical protein